MPNYKIFKEFKQAATKGDEEKKAVIIANTHYVTGHLNIEQWQGGGFYFTRGRKITARFPNDYSVLEIPPEPPKVHENTNG